MRAFVTGLDGFVGQWLARELLAAGDEVAGGSRNAKPSYTVLEPAEAAHIRWYQFELNDAGAAATPMSEWKPDTVYHLAAQPSVAAGLERPLETFEANVLGTAKLLEACRTAAPGSTILHVGSADAYGTVTEDDQPLRETAPLRPNNPYAASKAAAESIALQYARSGWLRVVATRSFNHTGPGQRAAFAAPAFARQIADIARGARPHELRVGNLNARRDLSDVRDVVHAYRLLGECGRSGAAYNVCSGQAISMRQVVDELIRIAGVDVKIVVDPERLRPVDTPIIFGDNARLRDDTGWSPAIPLSQTLADLYEWCRQVPSV